MDNGELDIVSNICNDLNIIPTIIKDEFNAEDLHSAVYHYEYSLDLGSLMPNYLLFKNCKNSLVLTGDGSDELFSGYERSKYSDTWEFDVFKELPYYHNIRLDRMSMLFTKEARNPLMSLPLLRYSRFQNRLDMVGKRHLRELYKNILPDYIINGKKLPLRYKHDKEYNIQLIKSKHKEIWQKMKGK